MRRPRACMRHSGSLATLLLGWLFGKVGLLISLQSLHFKGARGRLSWVLISGPSQYPAAGVCSQTLQCCACASLLLGWLCGFEPTTIVTKYAALGTNTEPQQNHWITYNLYRIPFTQSQKFNQSITTHPLPTPWTPNVLNETAHQAIFRDTQGATTAQVSWAPCPFADGYKKQSILQ